MASGWQHQDPQERAQIWKETIDLAAIKDTHCFLGGQASYVLQRAVQPRLQRFWDSHFLVNSSESPV